MASRFAIPRVAEAAPSVNATEDAHAKYDGSGPWWVCKPDAVAPPRFAAKGPASEADCPATTLPKLLADVKTKNGSKHAFAVERPCPSVADGKAPPALAEADWMKWTWAEAMDDIKNAAKGMITLGFARFDSVNVWGFNAPEWIMSALAAGFAGGKVAGLYPTDTDETAAYKVVHSGGSIVVLEEKKHLDKLLKGLSGTWQAKRIKAFVTYSYDPADGEEVEVPGQGKVPVISWSKLLEIGSKEDDKEMEERIAQTQPGHCAALIYTSGTTGEPKAVMISHDNIIYESQTFLKVIAQSTGFGAAGEQERVLSYLPLSHVAGMMLDIVSPAVNSATDSFTTVYFARPYDLKVGAIKDRLQVAKPTVFLGVPLVWEKIADKVRAIGAANTGLKKSLGDWAKGKALSKAKGQQLGGSGDTPWFHGAAIKLLSAVKANLGLECLKFALTGAAPIRVDTLEYFGSLGIQINECYGMSECTGACTISTTQAHQWGSCGYELPGCQVRVFKVDDKDPGTKQEPERARGLDETDEKFMGEICWKGRNNMMGYMAQPDLGEAHVQEIMKKNAECIDEQGWLHSGDKGLLSRRGMVKITGRYKELIIGEGGENIAPVPIEDSVKKLCDGICEVMLVGDKRKYNVALITLKAVGANGESPGTDELDAGAKRVNADVQTISAAIDDETWEKAIQDAIDQTNKNPKVCVNNAFMIQKWTILPTNFSEEGNELTPTKKLKRTIAETKYKDLIDKMYATDGKYIRYSA